MAYEIRNSPQRTFKPERHRIRDELARVQQILHPGNLTSRSQYIPSIKDISVHGFWDGIVGHPVDVKICLMVCSVWVVVVAIADLLVLEDCCATQQSSYSH